MTSCCKQSNRSLSQSQFEEVVNKIPDYPKKNNFTKEEQKRIANIPPLFKDYLFKIIQLTKCAKQNICG